MRFTISTDDDRITLRDSRSGHSTGWYLGRDGLKGWFGTPPVREEPAKASAHDADFWPPRLTQGGRVVTLPGIICSRSTVELARDVDRVNALAGKRLAITCEDAHGERTATGFLSDDPEPTIYPDELTASFELVITCPDPHKYGRWVAYAGSGLARVKNSGTAPSYPRAVVTGSPVTYVTLTCGGQSVSWSGSAESVSIDLADLAPDSGAITQDNSFVIPPGGADVRVETNGLATLYGRDAWR